MIALKRNEEPEILRENGQLWLNELKNVDKPEAEYTRSKGSIYKELKRDEITQALLNCSHNKCAYCECQLCKSSMEVDHFFPKSKYIDKIFEWDNLIPSCHICNSFKSVSDHNKDPLLNPFDTDPEDYLEYCTIEMIPKRNINDIAAKNTIECFKLNRESLIDERSHCLASFEKLKIKLKDILLNCNTEKKTKNNIANIFESLALLRNSIEPSNCYSGFIRFLVKSNDIFKTALKILSENGYEFDLYN